MNRSILIVDDDGETRELFRNMLMLVGYRVFEARDGIEALEKIRRKRPHAVILDVMMPRMDGIAVCETLRQKKETANLPILMVTAQPHQASAEECLQAGANKYLLKPVPFDVMVRNLQEVLRK